MFIKKSKKINNHEKIATLGLDLCFAKTKVNNGVNEFGLSVYQHCYIVGMVLKVLLESLPEKFIERKIFKNLPFLAAIHDIGKISPNFQKKIYSAVNENNIHNEITSYDSSINHAFIGYLTINKLLGEFAAYIVGAHHGYIDLSPLMYVSQPDGQQVGGISWENLREEIFSKLKILFPVNENIIDDNSYKYLATGMVTVADWIGSSEFFNSKNNFYDVNDDYVRNFVKSIGFCKHEISKGLTFEKIFGFSPRPFQKVVTEMMKNPVAGIYIVEASMGEGKTEAALYSAYKMMENNLASGIYFALPSQVTSNRMYGRMRSFLKNILSPKDHFKLKLAHSYSSIIEQELLADIGEECKPGNSWFDANKRSLLNCFGIGTIDQLLLAVMNVKHSNVRVFGIYGKVIIIDEVHTYDAYTSGILTRLLSLLKQLKCTVIILSATLSSEKLKKLIGANESINFYPSITSLNYDSENISSFSTKSLLAKKILIQFHTENECIEEAIERVNHGEYVLWIENIVTDAQRIYQIAKQKLPIELIGLIHSHFTIIDRQSKEDILLNAFEHKNNRTNKGFLLIGTQILEQSLDLDADFEVSAFAPSDMLLQRTGRLWRHSETPRPVIAKCECWLKYPDNYITYDTNNISAQNFGNSAKVYDPYVLARSLETFTKIQESKKFLNIPSDIREIISSTYDDRTESGTMLQMKLELDEKIQNEINEADTSSNESILPLSRESQFKTRRGIPQINILIVKSIKFNKKNCITEIILPDDTSIEVNNKVKEETTIDRVIASKLLKNIVHCHSYCAPTRLSREEINELGLNRYLYSEKHDESCTLSVMKTDFNGLLTNIKEEANDKYFYKYTKELGLEIINKNE